MATMVGSLPYVWRQRQPLLKIETVAKAMALMPEYRYLHWIGHISTEERMNLYTDDFRAVASESDAAEVFAQAFQQSHSDNWVDATLNADVEIYLTDDLLVKMDRATMAHSLETRSPFLDHHYMEFVAQLPAALKLNGNETKVALKASLRGILPDSILDRSKKGFDVPLAAWFREDLREMAHDILLSQKSLQRGYFQSREISRLLSEHDNSLEDHSMALWDLLVLELWHRTFIDGVLSHPVKTNSMMLNERESKEYPK
jgi:asparagine synthase (glutamine-hydrolysing)